MYIHSRDISLHFRNRSLHSDKLLPRSFQNRLLRRLSRVVQREMKVVALVSGGKDSCLNMLHCVANGHQIVALANLRPPSHSDKGLSASFLSLHDVFWKISHTKVYLSQIAQMN